ncbi:M20/M25/M40 family metallo-hydrolase [Rothia kristinae]|uniref:M20/M25/M40 family metallo-hydrolase n=1 Tax=Rothia kristinae TaxID=37923 RepID=UPI001CD1A0D4|nr:M20/M25/M40 family metallo-hydrolase [Rothia kristinae]MCA1169799.1 M20/M25/M40 family metallo-hydrolase [Rothia kristinae]
MLVYGHGDVQFGHADDWSEGRSPWHLSIEGDALYGRGSADNKGQHTVDLCALGAVIGVRGKLGYNVTVLIEMGEEAGSVGLSEIVREHAGDRHSGNWGGRVRNPATVLAAAIGAFVDGDGVIRADFLRPSRIPDPVRRAVQALPEPADDGGPAVDRDWGEPGLSPNERVFAWNTVEVLALEAGDPAEPKNAIPARARAVLQLRYVVGTDVSDFAAKAERVLRERGIRGVTVRAHEPVLATRLDPAAPVVRAAEVSIAETVGREPAVEPNLGGTIPNAVFADQLGLPTVWIPHSPPGSNQHAPDEHALASVLREGLRIMAGVFWDMGERPEQWFRTGPDRPGIRG